MKIATLGLMLALAGCSTAPTEVRQAERMRLQVFLSVADTAKDVFARLEPATPEGEVVKAKVLTELERRRSEYLALFALCARYVDAENPFAGRQDLLNAALELVETASHAHE